MSLRAALVAVGDELLSGATADANSPWLARALEELGVQNVRTEVAGDDEEQAARAIADALAAADLVIVTGGLGPTEDDQTRHAAARAAGRPLRHSEEAWRGVLAWFERRGAAVPSANRRQALLPEGAEILPNAVGTAPGFALEQGGKLLVSLPGPPFEMRAMFDALVRPRLAARAAGGLALHRFQLHGLSESVFAEQVGDWMARGSNPLIGCSVKDGILTATLRGRGRDAGEARRLVEARAAEFRARFGAHVFLEGDAPVERALGELLIARGITVTAAESCTTGLVAAQLGRVPGISAVLRAAFVVYSDAAKTELLGVRPETLAAHGAVSEPVAREMAAGAAQRAGARAAVAVSGVAGPGGGTPEKPVGTVAFAVWLDGAGTSELRRLPPTSRDHIRITAANTALVMLYRRAAGAPD